VRVSLYAWTHELSLITPLKLNCESNLTL
jgi:hypothetical protein